MENKTEIESVFIKEIVSHVDDRGFFREIIRETDEFFKAGFGQWSHSLVYQGTIKAWHLHNSQSQWTYPGTGTIQVALHDTRENSPSYRKTIEFLSGYPSVPMVYSFPPGVAHGYKCLNGPANVFYITSGQYDLDDEVRLSHDDPEIGYDWITQKVI
jgi:dTDP-4-dehydrorhamnose 3,5-epimerase